MAKNITIREGDTSKQFTAKKLKMNLVGGGTTNFVPEDEVLDYVNLKDHTFNQSGTFNPSQFNCDGFRQVKIDIPADVKEKVITKNGVFNAGDDNCLGYSKVTVNVPSGGGGGPYTVNFINGEELLQSVQVPYGGTAEFDQVAAGGYPQSPVPGQTFAGWNPPPVNVIDNMNCYAKFKDKQILIGEIGDSWDVIIANKGEPYPLGSYKTLSYGSQFTKKEIQDSLGGYSTNNSHFNNLPDDTIIGMTFDFLCVKVAEGEDGTTSTWLTSTIQLKTDSDVGGWNFDTMMALPQDNGGANLDYRQFIGRHFLNGVFREHMVDMFKNAIRPVTKYTQYGTNATPPFDIVATEEYIWIPSVKEMATTDVSIVCCSGDTTKDEYKYVGSVVGAMSYFRDSLPLTTAELNQLLAFGSGTSFSMRDVTNSKDGPWGGWRTPTMSFGDNQIWNMGSSGRAPHGWMATDGTNHFIFGFCL